MKRSGMEPHRRGPAIAILLAVLWLAGGCGREPGEGSDSGTDIAQATPSEALVRATRRAYDGAPPVIPHEPFPSPCTQCHNESGMAVSGVGFAPPSPHEQTTGLSEISRCQQCHVFRATTDLFKENDFVGFPQDLRAGSRLHSWAPPVMPHDVFMRENCHACHTGPAARDEIRTSHPERTRCRQCHVPTQTHDSFARSQP